MTVKIQKEPMIVLTEAQIQKMITCAVKASFKELGLHDDMAGVDVKELRSFLDAFRSAKTVIWKTILTLIVTGMMMMLSMGGYTWLNK
jgi:hypothetical protein